MCRRTDNKAKKTSTISSQYAGWGEGGRSKMRDRNKTKPWRQPHYIECQRKTELTECFRAKTKFKGLITFRKEALNQRPVKMAHSAFVVLYGRYVTLL